MAYEFKEKILPQGFVDKEDDSLLAIYALVRGSYNTVVNDEGKIASRKGSTRVGDAGTSTQGIKASYTWQTNTNKEIGMRFPYDKVQVLYSGQWKDVGSGFKTQTKFRCRPWWDRTEVKDKLLMVNGTSVVSSWTGGFTEIASWTAGSVTKKYAKQSAVANSFTFNAAGKTLTQISADFITLGFVANQSVRITGTTNNNGIFKIKTVAASVITFAASDILTNEVIATTACIIGVLGRETWAAERFASTGVKTVNIGGVVYTYTAGENTPTLTLTTDPSATSSVGLFVFQPIASNTPTGGDFPVGQLIDVIEVNINQTFYGYTESRNVFLAKQSSFTDCGYNVTVRKAGEGGTIFLDSNCVGIASSKELTQISAGTSDIYNITFESYSDGTTLGETINVKKLETAFGQGSISQDCFVKVKNGIAYISNEPTIDFLGNIENITTLQSKPLSDSIKRLLNGLSLTGANGVYYKNYIIYLLPEANVVIMYDMERGFWQPPQYVGGSSLSVIGGVLYVHSAVTDESYSLFTGLTDNGKPIGFAVFTNIDTYGTRSIKKIHDEIFVEALVNGAANNVRATLACGYQGATFLHPFNFGFNDADRFVEVPALPSGWGSSPIGTQPFGGLFTDPTIDPDIGTLKKIYKISGTNIQQAYTHQMQFTCDELGAYFEIVCYGVNARLADDNSMDIKEGEYIGIIDETPTGDDANLYRVTQAGDRRVDNPSSTNTRII